MRKKIRLRSHGSNWGCKAIMSSIYDLHVCAIASCCAALVLVVVSVYRASDDVGHGADASPGAVVDAGVGRSQL